MHLRLLALALSLTVSGPTVESARLSRGAAPLPPPQTVGWSEVFLDVAVSATGRVRAIGVLRATEPLGGLLRAAVEHWRFEPARQDGEAISSRLLIAAVYRPATLYSTPRWDGPPVDPQQPSAQIPLPTFTPAPPYPPRALGDGVVLVEVLVGADGGVQAATVVQSSARGFNAAAVDTALRWQFRPARLDGVTAPTFAYLVFGFRQPVIAPLREAPLHCRMGRPRAMWVLTSEQNGREEGITLRILPGHVKTIGRSPGADFIVDSAMVSRLHCRLSADAEALVVEDLQSTNGTFVNDRRVARAALTVGDRLRIGRLALTVGQGAE